MVRPEKQHQALHALHYVLIRARSMGYQGQPPREIADVLDWAELLPVHLAADEDRTADYRNALSALSQMKGFAGVLAIFDSEERSRFA
jgi:hypothetical protein